MSETIRIHCPIRGVIETPACELQEVAPLIEHLRDDRPVEAMTVFPRGTVTPDGRLDLCKQSIGPAGCRMVTEALRGNTSIASLLMGTDGIGDAGAGDVARLIEGDSSLEIVYLGCNFIGDAGIVRLADALSRNATVTGLWLKRNPIGEAGALALAEMLRHNRTLRILDLVNAVVGPKVVDPILDVLTYENRSIARLYLSGNGIFGESAARFADLLRHNSTLEALLLSVNFLRDAGAEALSGALRENRTLEELSLASNGITAVGASHLAEALGDHPSLTRLDLGYSVSTRALGASSNSLGDAGAEAMAGLLRRNRVLRHLDLRGNGITGAGREPLIAALEGNTCLRRLLLDGKPDPRITALLGRNHALAIDKDEPTTDRDIALIRSVYRTKQGRGGPPP